ncbi:FkbM family methyltransferase [Flavisolibacter nicotianae]|uniref:FkbM family methyltransferase n=1 Tax=Flavisolibacter nicotianae TaxID=2364882 RepID=UPI000EB41091|nr:FkbM family methyltransferase [Flavisolibacter nicotianae]
MNTRVDVLLKWLAAALLKLAGFKNIRGHWFYEQGIEKNKPVVVDLGANTGEFSKMMSCHYGANCFLVEPNASLISAMDFDANKKFNFAIAKRDGPLPFYVSSNAEASSLMEGFADNWKNDRVETVCGLSWSSLLEKLAIENSVIDLVKVDVEGAELDLFETFTWNELARIKQISVEYHDWVNKNLHKRTIETIKKLNTFGFVSFTDAPNHSWPVEMIFLNKDLVKMQPRDKAIIHLYYLVNWIREKRASNGM